jgi:hypothetical protein
MFGVLQKHHTHPCRFCGKPVLCPDDYTRQHQGLYEKFCPSFHLIGHDTNPTWICDVCWRRENPDILYPKE